VLNVNDINDKAQLTGPSESACSPGIAITVPRSRAKRVEISSMFNTCPALFCCRLWCSCIDTT